MRDSTITLHITCRTCNSDNPCTKADVWKYLKCCKCGNTIFVQPGRVTPSQNMQSSKSQSVATVPPVESLPAEIGKCKSCNRPVSKDAPSCPHCGEPFPSLVVLEPCRGCGARGNRQFRFERQGFSLAKAAVGAVLFGPLWLAGGAHGNSEVIAICRNCGRRVYLK
jgi:hypothetical protein